MNPLPLLKKLKKTEQNGYTTMVNRLKRTLLKSFSLIISFLNFVLFFFSRKFTFFQSHHDHEKKRVATNFESVKKLVYFSTDILRGGRKQTNEPWVWAKKVSGQSLNVGTLRPTLATLTTFSRRQVDAATKKSKISDTTVCDRAQIGPHFLFLTRSAKRSRWLYAPETEKKERK